MVSTGWEYVWHKFPDGIKISCGTDLIPSSSFQYRDSFIRASRAPGPADRTYREHQEPEAFRCGVYASRPRPADQSATDRNWSTPSRVALEAGFHDVASILTPPDEDSTSATDSNESDPSFLGLTTHPEEHPTLPLPTSENDAPGPLQLAGLESSLEINSKVLAGGGSKTRSSSEPRRSARLCNKATSMMGPDNVQNAAVPSAPCKRPRLSSERVKDSTEGVKPKRRRNGDKGIQVRVVEQICSGI